MDAIKKLRDKVIEANRLYDDLRVAINVPPESPYQSEGIKALSEPFVKGVFTLAVIGNMSAGKSAFINALLEEEDLLPMGHFQTTCALTEIVWAPEKKLFVTFGDGRKQEVLGEDANQALQDLVAINPVFESLPINHINELILLGKNYQQILERSDVLQKVSGRRVDPELLAKYVNGCPSEGILPKTKSNIPTRVTIEYPLLDSFRGWRIVDTPGIGALGGIDQTTKDFLVNETVDAAIFVFNGTGHIDKSEVSTMVKTSYNELTDVAKERTFFVVTHAGDQTCRSYLDKTMKTALSLFSDGEIAIPKERFFAVDSMLSLLYDIAIVKHNLDATIFNTLGAKIEGMDKNEIKMYRAMVLMISEEIVEEGKEINTENLNDRICEIAGFQTLKTALGDFARDAKKEAYVRLFSTIQEDIDAFGSKKKEERELWASKITKSASEFKKEIEAKKREITAYKNDLLRKFNLIMSSYSGENLVSKFPKSYERLQKRVNTASDVVAITNAYENFEDMFSIEENVVLQKFSNECKDMQVTVNAQHSNVILPPIDIEGAKSVAREKATHTKSRTYTVVKSGAINKLKSWWDRLAGTKIAKYETKTEYYDVVVPEEELEALKAEVLSQAMESMTKYSVGLFDEIIKPTGVSIQQQIDKLVKIKNAELDAILVSAENASEIEAKIKQIDVDLTKIAKARNTLNTLSKIA